MRKPVVQRARIFIFDPQSVSQWVSAKISYFHRSISQNPFKSYIIEIWYALQDGFHNYNSVSQMGSLLQGGQNWLEMVRVNSVQRVRPSKCSNLACARCALWFGENKYIKLLSLMIVSYLDYKQYISYKNSPNFLLNMFHLEPTPLSLNKKNISDRQTDRCRVLLL